MVAGRGDRELWWMAAPTGAEVSPENKRITRPTGNAPHVGILGEKLCLSNGLERAELRDAILGAAE